MGVPNPQLKKLIHIPIALKVEFDRWI